MCSDLDGMSPFSGVLLLSLKTGLDWEGSSLFIGMDALILLIIHLWFLVQIYIGPCLDQDFSALLLWENVRNIVRHLAAFLFSTHLVSVRPSLTLG